MILPEYSLQVPHIHQYATRLPEAVSPLRDSSVARQQTKQTKPKRAYVQKCILQDISVDIPDQVLSLLTCTVEALPTQEGRPQLVNGGLVYKIAMDT